MKVASLASGSAGNAYCIEAEGEILLVDCGISCRELKKRCAVLGLDPQQITAVVFTHNHTDHVRGLKVFHSTFPSANLFANMMTAEAISQVTEVDESEFVLFENYQEFEFGPFTILPFSVPHDVPDPVGFLIKAEGKNYFHATDVGTPLDSIGRYLSSADVATLESNHDPLMLSGSTRPDSLKRRIRGQCGHLSNDDAAELVSRFATDRLKHLFLAHLSGECNAAHIAERTMRIALERAGKNSIAFKTLCQDTPSIYTC